MAKPATFFANFPVNKQPSTSEVIRRYGSTYEGCALVPLVTSSIGDSELITHFQEAYARVSKSLQQAEYSDKLAFLHTNEPGNYLCESIT